MKRIDVIKSFHKELSGIEFLRNAVYWLDGRNEWINDNKNPIQLLQDYIKAIEKEN